LCKYYKSTRSDRLRLPFTVLFVCYRLLTCKSLIASYKTHFLDNDDDIKHDVIKLSPYALQYIALEYIKEMISNDIRNNICTIS